MLRVLLLLALLGIGAYYARRWLARLDPARLQQWLRQGALIGGGGLILLLMARGGLAAALLLPLLLPLLRSGGLSRLSSVFGGSSSGYAGNAGQSSVVTTRFLRMSLDHGNGEIQGSVLTGSLQGRTLASLSETERQALWQECQSDPQSVAVLEAYLDRMHPNWRQRHTHESPDSDADTQQQRRTTRNTRMDRQEACQILGVATDASRDDIKAAHRRLMQKFHPDHGGSGYLAARINEAKDVLLKG